MTKEVIAYRCLFEECEEVTASVRCAYEVLPDTLIVEPGNYKVFDKIYSLNKNGLYRFVQLRGVSRQVIVYGGDIDILMSALSWITVHGNDDNDLSLKEKYQKALCQKLVINCGYVALWASAILCEEGIKNRIVTTLTLDEWNSYDNGHTMLEVYKENIDKWAVYDIDNGITFYSESKSMNIVELCEAVCQEKPYQIQRLTSAAKYANSSEYYLLVEKDLSGEKNMRRWFKRVLQVPLIRNENGDYYFFDKENRNRVEGYTGGYLYIEKNQFINYYYSVQTD